jgi:hypothetical protein
LTTVPSRELDEDEEFFASVNHVSYLKFFLSYSFNSRNIHHDPRHPHGQHQGAQTGGYQGGVPSGSGSAGGVYGYGNFLERIPRV